MMTPGDQLPYLLFWTLYQNFNATVPAVLHPTVNAQAHRFSAGGVPEPYPLDPTLDNKSYPDIIHSLLLITSEIHPRQG